jgi:hypothetical protein
MLVSLVCAFASGGFVRDNIRSKEIFGELFIGERMRQHCMKIGDVCVVTTSENVGEDERAYD